MRRRTIGDKRLGQERMGAKTKRQLRWYPGDGREVAGGEGEKSYISTRLVEARCAG